MADSPHQNINRALLRELLLKHVVSDDLRSFCFELDEPYENIVGPNDKLNTAIINVVDYFSRRGRVTNLIDRAKQEFPNATWDEVFVATEILEISAASTGTATVRIKPQVKHERIPGPLRVFLCHASDDKPAVRDLYAKLKAAGSMPWLDEEDLLPGQKWRVEIPKAIQNSDVILVCVSKKSANRDGYVKREIEFALDIADKQPDDTTFVIPARLEECEFPERVGDFHGVNLFDIRGMERLMRALQNRAQTLLIDLSALNFRLELVRVPAGEFLMGSNLNLFKFAEDNEKPQHRVYLNEYFIGRYPVTVAQFAVFVAETCYRTEAERDGYEVVWQHPHDKSSYVHSKQHPVVCVTWNDAIAFCEWLSRQTGHVVSLPTEAEWEKAARWDATKQKARIWPWGNTFDKSKTNTNESRVRDTTPVGVYSAKGGDSLYGCADMAGNIWEWCADWYDGNEYKKRANMVLRNPSGPAAGDYRVLRGGSYFYHGSVARCACRLVDRPNYGVGLIGLNGFRVVVRSHSLASGL